jgi:hypothetical protein
MYLSRKLENLGMKRGGNPNGREETVEVGNMRKGSKGEREIGFGMVRVGMIRLF